MKLIIQIPCLNEALHLPATLAELPRKLPGFDQVEVLIVDDGSADDTSEVAIEHGADHVVRLRANKGLANAFQVGLDAALKLGADVVVNTDADNQYRASDIARLVEPIMSGQADLVIGDRQVTTVDEFSASKKVLQRVGSWVVRKTSSTDVPDATSGFRAYSREGALDAVVMSGFTYTLETIIRAGRMGTAITTVPVNRNETTRESRLFRSPWQYVKRSAGTILRTYTMYSPLRVFLGLAGVVALIGAGLLGRFLWFYATIDGPTGHQQSLIIGVACLMLATQLAAIGVIGDLLRANRILSERIEKRVRQIEVAAGVPAERFVGNGISSQGNEERERPHDVSV